LTSPCLPFATAIISCWRKQFKHLRTKCFSDSLYKNIPWPVVRKRTIPTEWPPLVGEVSANFWDRRCRVVSARIPTAVNIYFLDRSHYFLQIAPRLSSRSWVNPVPDPILLRKPGSAGNRTRDLWICSQELWPLDHRGGLSESLFVS
jgi:hypothetical protein